MKELTGIRPLWAEIDLDRLESNMRGIRRIVRPDARIAAAVKADGYGHGAVGVAESLLANGADYLATATLDEALELRRAGVAAGILALGYTQPERAREVVAHGIEQCMYRLDDAVLFAREAARQERDVRFQIKIDSGMGRLGYRPDADSVREIIKISRLPRARISGIFTHFCDADAENKDFTRRQYEQFQWLCGRLEAAGIDTGLRHCANSAALLELPEYHCDLVRPGILLYGIAPSPAVKPAQIRLRPALALKCKVSHVKEIMPGDSVGYGRTYIADRRRTIATLPAGYADGYSRRLSGRAHVLVHGRRAPVVGMICMDQCMIDVTGIENVRVGDEAALFGQQGVASLPVEELAALLDTIPHEILCSLARRVPRVYKRGDKICKIIQYC